MAFGNIETNRFIHNLTHDALESGAEEDRFLAIKTANAIDGGNQTNYRKTVLNLFVLNAGFYFIREPTDSTSECFSSETERVGKVMVQVAKALDPELAPKITIDEIFDANDGLSFVHHREDGFTGLDKHREPGLLLPDGNIAVMDISTERPYSVSLAGASSEVGNFNTAVRAVLLGR